MKAVYALYSEPKEVQRAIDGLHQAGVADETITVISSEPIEEYPFSHRHAATWLYRIAAGGGLLGLIFGTWLTSFTQKAWPLVTSNMPVVSWWTNLIVMFELTMLGGVLATVVTLFITARLGLGAASAYDPAVTAGKILVSVERPAESVRARIEEVLLASGETTIQTI